MEDFSKMITDNRSNFVYLADTLEQNYPAMYRRLTLALKQHSIKFGILPGTKDIWARDYMPVQCAANDFVLFRYDPDYLKPKKWEKTKTDALHVCNQLNIPVRQSSLIVDGGNVIRGQDFVIMTDKVFKENSMVPRDEVHRQLTELFGVEVIIIPRDPSDYTGHADGMVRYYKDRTVLINRYGDADQRFAEKLKKSLRQNNLDFIEIPYCPYNNVSNNEACGMYINFLQLAECIIIPSFGLAEDDDAMLKFRELFPGEKIVQVESSEIAVHGGVLNCISWTVALN